MVLGKLPVPGRPTQPITKIIFEILHSELTVIRAFK